jgi:hypothetical protein
MSNDPQVDDYLVRLRKALSGMSLAEREDIVQEICMHIRERAEDGGASTEEILIGLGPAGELAEQYRTGLLVQKARRSISPLLILRAAMRWALTGVEGTAVFLIAVFGYLTGVGFLLLALLKPIFPQRTGLWVGPNDFDFSIRMGALPVSTPQLHEVLGWWFIPVCAVIGSFALIGTTKLIQFLMKRFRWRTPLAQAMLASGALTAGWGSFT